VIVIWQKLSHGGKVGCVSGVAASIVGAMGVGLAVGAMMGGFFGFILVAGIVIVFGSCAGAAIGHAMYRFDIWRKLKLGGKVGCVLGILLATLPAISIGDTVGAAIGISLGERLAGNVGALMGLVLGFTLTMGTILVVSFGVGGAIGDMTQRFFDPSPHESVA
jgi:hypothetical protein